MRRWALPEPVNSEAISSGAVGVGELPVKQLTVGTVGSKTVEGSY